MPTLSTGDWTFSALNLPAWPTAVARPVCISVILLMMNPTSGDLTFAASMPRDEAGHVDGTGAELNKETS